MSINSIKEAKDFGMNIYYDLKYYLERFVSEFSSMPSFIQILSYIAFGYIFLLGSFQVFKKVLLGFPKFIFSVIALSVVAFLVFNYYF